MAVNDNFSDRDIVRENDKDGPNNMWFVVRMPFATAADLREMP